MIARAIHRPRPALLTLVMTIMALVLSVAAPANAAAYDTRFGPETGSKRVVYTIDDCPLRLADYKKVVEGATKINVGLVLALTGECIARYKRSAGIDIAAYARRHGHYVINHSTTHTRLTDLSKKGVQKEVLGGPGSRYVRPPFGAHDSKVRAALAEMKPMRLIWTWTVDPRDWDGKSSKAIVDYIVTHTKAGDVTLTHFQGKAFTVAALTQIKSGLAKKGVGMCRPFRGTDRRGKIVTTNVYFYRLYC